MEVLDAGRAPRRWPWVAVLVLVILAASVGWADGRARSDQTAAVAAAASKAELDIRTADAKVASIRVYASPGLFAPGDVRDGLMLLVRQTAAEQADVLVETRATVAEIGVWPWHENQRLARDAVVAYVDQWAEFLRQVALDDEALTMSRTPLTRAGESARQALGAAGDDAGAAR